MRKLLFGLAVALFATTASAQEEAKPFIGLGAEVGTGSYLIAVPMNITPVLRLEPFIGYHQHRNTDNTDPTTENLTWDSELTLGAGLAFLMDAGSNVELNFGGRLYITRVAAGMKSETATTTTEVDDSAMGFGVAAVGGAEYYFSPRFALGVEGQLYVETIEVEDVRDTDFGTAGFVTARVYFK